MSVSVLFIGNDTDISIQPFVDASTGLAIDDADLFFTVCEAGVTGVITGATNATPIVITSANHGLSDNDYVGIVGVGGNTAARGTFQITYIDANSFSLDSSVGNGAFTRGGRWYKALTDSIARAVEMPLSGTQYLGVLSGDIGLTEQARYAIVYYATGDYRDQFSAVDIATAQIRSGGQN